MSENAGDQAQRLEALDRQRSFIVQAPAGSGKTELLVQRFLTLLAHVEVPEAIVAITFTRKAAAEMRQRIIQALRRASDAEPETSHEKHTWALARKAVKQGEMLGWRLEEHPARLRVQTIDSLCSMLVRQMPLISRMGGARSPHEMPGLLYRMAARRTMALIEAVNSPRETKQALARLLTHLDNNVAAFERLLGSMLGRRDQWLRYVRGDSAPSVPRQEVESALERIVVPALKRARAAIPRQYRSEIVDLARFAAKNLERENPGHPLAACFELPGFPDATISSLPAWRGIAAMFLGTRGSPLRSINKNRGFPARTTEDRAAKDRWKKIELSAEAIRLLNEVRELPPTRFEDVQWDVLSALMHLLPVAVDQLHKVFRSEGHVDFAEIAIAARRAAELRAGQSADAGILDPAIRHLLIDEFQDTSQTQFDLLTRLVGDWRPEDGRTVFAVGDPMQSIYGFRQAEVGLFLRARTDGMGPVKLEPLSLSTNFRSTATVVQWVNRALSEAFPKAEETLTGAVTYEQSVAFKGEDSAGGVRVHPFFSAGQESEADRVLEIIEEAQSRRPGGTIAVLVLARTHLPGIVAALRKAGKGFRAVEIDALGGRPVVRDLMALTLALMHAGDRVAWLSILRAPWCGLSLEDLEALAGGSAAAIWDQLEDPACRERLSPDGSQRIARLRTVLRGSLALRGRLPVRRWVESTWMALAGPACLDNHHELEDAEAYLDLLERSVDGADLRDERQFAEDISSLFAAGDDAADGSLQLMTIHKAKGLEFDTVILPGLGRTPRPQENPLLLWREFMDGERSRLVLAPIKETGGKDDSIYKHLKKIEKARRHNETTRLLYVAATRARHDLHLLGHVNIDRDKRELKNPPAGVATASTLENGGTGVQGGFGGRDE